MSDENAIRNIIADYCSLADQNKYEDWAALFADYAVVRINGDVAATGSDEIYSKFKNRGTPPGTHVATNVHVEVNEDDAVARGDFFFINASKVIAAVGRYDARLQKRSGGWRIGDWHIRHW